MDFKFINTSYIESVTGGDKEILTELIVLFRDQAAEISAEMKELYEKKEYYTLGLLAHKAKSSVAIMGMTELAALLKTFELEAKANKNTDSYATYISRFESDTLGAISELDSYLKDL